MITKIYICADCIESRTPEGVRQLKVRCQDHLIGSVEMVPMDPPDSHYWIAWIGIDICDYAGVERWSTYERARACLFARLGIST